MMSILISLGPVCSSGPLGVLMITISTLYPVERSHEGESEGIHSPARRIVRVRIAVRPSGLDDAVAGTAWPAIGGPATKRRVNGSGEDTVWERLGPGSVREWVS